VVEAERWLNEKNSGITTYLPTTNPQIVFDEICDYLLKKAGRKSVDVYISGYMTNDVTPKFKYDKLVNVNHHESHAATAFYQSPFEKSLVVSYDGGGDGAFFNIYTADRINGIKLIKKANNDLGFPYMILADYMDDIKRDPLSIGNLVYAGKLMGLCSYGTVNEEWLPHFKEFYYKFKYSGEAYSGGLETAHEAVPALMNAIGLGEDFDMHTTRFKGQVSWDIAATTQRAFEEVFLEIAAEELEKYKDWPLSLAGGCALNVLLNARLLEMRGGNVFVPPNVNDCGIAVGSIMYHVAPKTQVDLTYSGLPVLDDMLFASYIQDKYKYTVYENVTVEELAEFIGKNNIVGMIQGNSEHGSRALGNRSIICNPSGDMKDVLNHKVKHREWYRPFAPIVRLEDANKYFHFDYNVESRHMTFVATVRDEWKDILPAITHTDGTARLQTVTRVQNPLIYDLIGEFEKTTGHAVILNTSFNVNGKPILTRLSDAFKILDESEMDAIYYKGNLIFKRTNDRKFQRSDKFVDKPVREGTAIYAFAMNTDPESAANIKANLEVVKEMSNVTIITDATGKKLFPLGKAHVYEVENRHVYMKDAHGKTTVLEAYPHISLLWAKEALHEDKFFCKYDVFVDLGKFSPKTFRKELKNIISMSENDSKLIISGIENYENVTFPISWQKKNVDNGKSFDDIQPTMKFYGGLFEKIEFLSNQWEAMYLGHNNSGRYTDASIEYLAPALAAHQNSIIIIEE
jgi:predicted NodU family carbamoyl transferase